MCFYSLIYSTNTHTQDISLGDGKVGPTAGAMSQNKTSTLTKQDNDVIVIFYKKRV